MGLDIYVGSLTRYFARDWKTIIQQTSESGHGPRVEIIRVNEPDDAVTDPDQIRSAVLAWRDGLSKALAAHTTVSLDWEERRPTPYFTDKPAWFGFGALVLWAAYAEQPDIPRPASNPVCLSGRKTGDWHDDPAYRRSVADGFRTRFGQLLDDVEVWLPAEYPFTFGAEWVTGKAVRLGSSTELLRQLDALNAETWNASAVELERWMRDGVEFEAPLEASARFGFSVVQFLTAKSVEHGLPMLLDY